MTPVEHAAIEERHGIHIAITPVEWAVKHKFDKTCAALGGDRRCQIWQDKETYPAICSAWGAVEHMPCPFGCVPKGGLMPVEDFKLLLIDIEDIGGSYVTTPMDRRRHRQLLSTRTGRRRLREHMTEAMASSAEWWDNYIATNPDNLPLGEDNG